MAMSLAKQQPSIFVYNYDFLMENMMERKQKKRTRCVQIQRESFIFSLTGAGFLFIMKTK